MTTAANREKAGGDDRLTLVVVGVGNIGSALVPLLAWLPRLARVIILDRDSYASENLRSQAISPADLGRPKAAVMARRLRAMAPHLAVEAIVGALEEIPAGWLRADVWLTCLDSRAARQIANELVHRLGVPLWLDSGVLTSELLARVSIYAPGGDRACLECLWNEDDYRDVAQSYTCDGAARSTPATNGVAELGALCASLLAIECRRELAGAEGATSAARELVVAAGVNRTFVSELRRNVGGCLFDHEVWQTESVCWRRLGDVAKAAAQQGGSPTLRIEGRAFARDVRCAACGRGVALATLAVRAPRARLRCRGCAAAIAVGGERIVHALSLADLPAPLARCSLRSIGLRAGDLLTLGGDGGEQHFELHIAPARGGDVSGDDVSNDGRGGVVSRRQRLGARRVERRSAHA